MILPEPHQKHQVSKSQIAADSPFALQNTDIYLRWRDNKLKNYPMPSAGLIVEVQDPRVLNKAETEALQQLCRKTNMAIYASPLARIEDKAIPRQLGTAFGLRRLDSNLLADDDGITSLQAVAVKSQRGYLPYSNKRLLWHTDGYYNLPDSRIRAFVLHCVVPAADGGDNCLLDHEMVYLQIRDTDPACIHALMAPDAMTIPANVEAGAPTRAAVSGPVFSVDPQDGSLHMRYTARTRSIEWKQDAVTRVAVQMLEKLLAGDSPYVFAHRLAAGQGLICNNVLHNRTSFTDDVDKGLTRLVYRARYYDRIAGTGLNEVFT